MKKLFYILYVAVMVFIGVLLTLILFGTFTNWPMYLGGYSSLFESQYSVQFLFLLIFLLILAYVIFKIKKTKLTKYILVAFGILSIGQLFIIFTLYKSAYKYELTLSFSQTLNFDYGVKAEHQTFSYLKLDGEEYLLDVYRPSDISKSSIPVILVHGGGYVAGSRTDDRFHQWFTERGYTVFDVDYPLATEEMQTWETAANSVATAISYVIEHTDKFNLNTSKLILCGGSAGGGLVMQTGYGLGNGNVKSYSSVAPIIPAAIIAVYPPVDLTNMWEIAGQGVLDMRPNAIKYIGGSPEEFPERYRRLDIMNSLRKDVPKTLIITGSHDHVVPVYGSRKLVKKAEEMQIPISYVEVPFGEHVFDANANSLSGQIKWLAMDKFLEDNHLLN